MANSQLPILRDLVIPGDRVGPTPKTMTPSKGGLGIANKRRLPHATREIERERGSRGG